MKTRNRPGTRCAPLVGRRYSDPLAGIACRTCSRIVDAATAEGIAERLRDLGCKPETITANAPICGRCARQVAELAVAITEGRAS